MTPGSHWLAALRRGHCLREILTGWLLAALLLMPVVGGSQEAAPAWWSQRGVIQPGAGLDDYAVINQGQLKNLVAAAVAEMNANLTGGAGAELNGTVSAWNASPQTADDFAAVNIGQLKAIALPVYQRLLSAGAIAALPDWANAQAEGGDDFALANLGQAKKMFSFSVPIEMPPAGQDDPDIERESLDALPVDSPFVIRYLSWRSGRVRPGRGEAGDLPEMATIYTGTWSTCQWVAGETPTVVPHKETVEDPRTVERDSLVAIETWRTQNHGEASFYKVHTFELDMSHYNTLGPLLRRSTTSTNGQDWDGYEVVTLPPPMLPVHFDWVSGGPQYEVVPGKIWREASYVSGMAAVHWFEQKPGGPVSPHASSWVPAPEVAVSDVVGCLNRPGDIIEYEDFPLPTAGATVATAHAVLNSVEQTYENAQGQSVTSTRYTGSKSRGFVSIEWRPEISQSLTLAEKQAWLARYRVTQKTTTTPTMGAAIEEVDTQSLSHYLEADATEGTESGLIDLAAELQDGTQQEVELSVSFLGLPVQPPLIMQALFAQQEVVVGGVAPFGLIVTLKQGGQAVANQQVTFEMIESDGGIITHAASTNPQPSMTVLTDVFGVAHSQFRASSSPGYSWIRASVEGASSQWFLMTVGGGSGGFPANPAGNDGVNFAHDSDGDGDSDAAELAAGTDAKDSESYIPDWKFRSMNIQFQAQYDIWSASNSPIYQAEGQPTGVYDWYTFRNSRILGVPLSAEKILYGPSKPDLPFITPYMKPEPASSGWTPQNQRNISWENQTNFNPFPVYFWNVDPAISEFGVNHFFLHSSAGQTIRAPVDVNDTGVDVGNFPKRQWISTAVRLELRSSKPRPRSFSALGVVERTRSTVVGGAISITTEIVESFTLTLPAQAPSSNPASNGPVSSEPIVLSYPPVMHCVDTYKVMYVPVDVESRDRAITGKISPFSSLMGGNKKFEIGFQAGGKSLGKYEISQSGSPQGVHIYNSENDIYTDSEFESGVTAINRSQEVVLIREGGGVRFYTVSDDLGPFEVLLYLDGALIGTVTHEMKKEDGFDRMIAAAEKFIAGDDPLPIEVDYTEPPPPLAASDVPPLDSDDRQNLANHAPADVLDEFGLGSTTTAANTSSGGTAATTTSTTTSAVIVWTDKEEFQLFVQRVFDEATPTQWTSFSEVLANAGYDLEQALGSGQPSFNWQPGGVPATRTEIDMPDHIRNRGLVARALMYWIKRLITAQVAVGEGAIFGVWDGVKGDVDGVVETLKMPVTVFNIMKDPWKAAGELHGAFKTIKEMGWTGVKQQVKGMFDSFMAEQQGRLDWVLEGDAQDPVYLNAYMGGYLAGYIGEQVAVTVLTAGIAKGGLVGKALKQGAQIVTTTLNNAGDVGRRLHKASKSLADTFSRTVSSANEGRAARRNGSLCGSINGCLAAGTYVLMANGSAKLIDKVRGGDSILADDPDDGLPPFAVVVETQIGSRATSWITLGCDFNKDSKADQTLKLTPEHPVFLVAGGWARAADVVVDDVLFSPDGGHVTVCETRSFTTDTASFNLDVGEPNTFFVSSDARSWVLVHNGEFDIGPYYKKDEPWKRHHGIMNKWLEVHLPFTYQSRASASTFPCISLSKADHDLATSMERNFMRGRSYHDVSAYEAKKLCEQIFDAVGVPGPKRTFYFQTMNIWLHKKHLPSCP